MQEHRSAAEVARKAAEIVQQHGLTKGEFYARCGAVCLWGALGVAATEGSSRSFHDRAMYGVLGHDDDEPGAPGMEMYDAFRLALAGRLKVPALGWVGAGFNDKPETTVEDVAKLLLQVADDLEVQS
jgi:hypothetical protein